MLAVSELFYSVQGEGAFAGTPAAFIRLQGCDVGCSFCDTKHTWSHSETHVVPACDVLGDAPRPKNSWAWLTIDQLHHWVHMNCAAGPLVVITGGEPLAQGEEVYKLAKAMLETGRQVQVETSGTEDHPVFRNNRIHVTVSPKWEGKRFVLDTCVENADEVKVVISSQKIIDRLRALNIWGPSLYLQPETGPNFQWSAEQCVKLCKEFGCKLSLQTHTFLNIR